LLKGESLFNDATALLLFGAALTVQARGGLDFGVAIELGWAAPGGVLFGVAFGFMVAKLRPLTENTVGGTLSQFVYAFATWLIAEHLHLSAVLATVASAMTIATLERVEGSPRMRVHSFAVWTTVVFLSHVVAFLLMGLQARRILIDMPSEQSRLAAVFVALVVVAVVVTRLVAAFLLHAVVARLHRRGASAEPFTVGETFLVGWSGMRGLVTLAAAFALQQDFPGRDLVVLTAFSVVLATLVLQGVTLAPIIHYLKLNRQQDYASEIEAARRALSQVALRMLGGEEGKEADLLKIADASRHVSGAGPDKTASVSGYKPLLQAIIAEQRRELRRLRDNDDIGPAQYLELQEDLDWKQLSVEPEDERRITEG
jgi:CPA1 family monovalent cation:H+ antiporter